MSYVRIIDGRNIVFFAVDQWIFERDVDRGFLGEALASLLIFPYASLTDNDYFHNQEIALKKRLILELLENLVLGYPELSYNIRIKPQYFMYEVMLSRVRVFPPMAYSTSDFLCGEANAQKVEFVFRGYMEALRVLEKEGSVAFSEGDVTLNGKFIEASKNPKTRFTNIIKNAPRTLFTSLFAAFPQLLNFLSQNSDALFKFQTPFWKKEVGVSVNFVDPQKYILVPTRDGFVSLADKMDIRGYVQHVLKTAGDYDKIKVEEFGGVLNDVYLIRACSGHSEKKILVKRFKDVTSMKWFPLSIWSIGARSFALLGRSRLEREFAINELLGKAGFRVPKILHVSAPERLVFMEFLEGENLSNAIKRIATAHSIKAIEKDIALVRQVGETYAKVHALNVVLGDTKPENIMVDPEGKLCLLDFEQASRSGDRSWDIACILYYCGHYLPLNGEAKAEAVAKAFIEGYLKVGGSAEAVKCAGIPRFTRVFSVFTLPGVLRVMSNECKSIQGPKCKRW
jgi:tRNA A-37 threonylcarbamoyl transferase component Bud32